MATTVTKAGTDNAEDDEDEKANEAERQGVERHSADSPAILVAPEAAPPEEVTQEQDNAYDPKEIKNPKKKGKTRDADDSVGKADSIPQPDPSPSVSN